MSEKEFSTICFGGQDWWYHNRGHVDIQFTRRCATLGQTLYVNSIVMMKPKMLGDRQFFKRLVRKMKSIFTGLKDGGEGFAVYSPFSIPLHHLAIGRVLNKAVLRLQLAMVSRKLGIRKPLVWVAIPSACDVAIAMKRSGLVYIRTDRYEDYPNVDVDAIRAYDRRLKQAADVTVFVNRKLYEEEGKDCKSAMYVDHGVDYTMFADADKDASIPEDMQGIEKPVIGFFGGVDDHTFDMPFMEKVVDLLPDVSFVFVGKASADCSYLLSKENVRMLDQKPYEQIPHYGKCFDVALMPWRQNDWIEACNPVKMKEYLALGKATVSTPFPELQGYQDVIYEAATPEAFADGVRRALREDCEDKVKQRQMKVCEASWESKVQQILDRLFDGNVIVEKPCPATS